jgi:class 3 adenylate cyclase
MAREVPRHFSDWQVRVGVHVGPAVSGTVGGERYQFDVWGKPVLLASSLAAAGEPGSVCVLAEFAALLNPTHVGSTCGPRTLRDVGERAVVDVATLAEAFGIA